MTRNIARQSRGVPFARRNISQVLASIFKTENVVCAEKKDILKNNATASTSYANRDQYFACNKQNKLAFTVMSDDLRKYAIVNDARQKFYRLETAYYDSQEQLATEYLSTEDNSVPDYSVTVNNSFIESSWHEPTPSIRSKLEEYRWKIRNDCCCIL